MTAKEASLRGAKRRSNLPAACHSLPPQALDLAIADRGDLVCSEPLADRAAREQREFAGAPAGMLRGDAFDLARRRRVQGEMRDSRRQALDGLAVTRHYVVCLDRQGAAEMID